MDFSVREEISTPFEVDLTLATTDDEVEVIFDDVIGEIGLLTIFGLKTDSERYFHGIVNKFWQTGSTGDFFCTKPHWYRPSGCSPWRRTAASSRKRTSKELSRRF